MFNRKVMKTEYFVTILFLNSKMFFCSKYTLRDDSEWNPCPFEVNIKPTVDFHVSRILSPVFDAWTVAYENSCFSEQVSL